MAAGVAAIGGEQLLVGAILDEFAVAQGVWRRPDSLRRRVANEQTTGKGRSVRRSPHLPRGSHTNLGKTWRSPGRLLEWCRVDRSPSFPAWS